MNFASLLQDYKHRPRCPANYTIKLIITLVYYFWAKVGTHKISTRVGSKLPCKYQDWLDVAVSDKHTSLIQYKINNGCKMFYSTGQNPIAL
jgi:hypothetical protein